MNLFRELYNIVLDAVFPLSGAEHEIAAMSPVEALTLLPPAPPYDGSVVPLENTSSLFAYKDERVSRLVWSIKYKNDQHAVAIGAYALYEKLKTLNGTLVLIPTPVTPKRRRERGYNQCELLIEEIKRLDTKNHFLYLPNLLERTTNTEAQKTKSRTDRLDGTKNLYGVNKNDANTIEGSPCIIIIDDVITTGSTMKAAQDALRSAGFSNVGGLSVAH